MGKLKDISEFLDQELQVNEFNDVSLNGLQIEGSREVSSIAVAVDSGLSIIEQAIELGAQLLIVHHGLFWGKPLAIHGAHKTLLEKCFNSGLSLYACHLPLDAHLKYGNNAALAKLIELENVQSAFNYQGKHIGVKGLNSKKLTFSDINSRLTSLPGATNDIHSLNFGPKVPASVGILSGSGADVLEEFNTTGFDTLITGESKQFAYHFSKDNKLNAIFAGHYATETLGVQELGKLLKSKFNVQWRFIDHPTGI